MTAMDPILRPENVEDLKEAVLAHEKVMVCGANTKPSLSAVSKAYTRLSTSNLSGILEYDPSEFTFTALAGTPLREIENALAENGQYLTFDPPLVEAGATLGGTLAAGLSGPGSYRFGGVRDFVLGIQYIDGRGEVIRSGGKVVKNAAGFDLPKFFCGSLGRYGVLTELTFKVFPCPPATQTVSFAVDSIESAVKRIQALSRGALDLDALEFDATGKRVLARLRGQPEALKSRVDQLDRGDVMNAEEGANYWKNHGSFAWASGRKYLIKVPITLRQLTDLDLGSLSIDYWLGIGGNLLWIGSDEAGELHDLLSQQNLRGLILRGPAANPLIGTDPSWMIADSVKNALDPNPRFPELYADAAPASH